MHPSAAEINDSVSQSPLAPPKPPSPVSMQVPSGHDLPAKTSGTTQTKKAINPKNPLGASKFSSHSLVPWSTGLCDCCENVSSCCLTCWCPCVTFGRIAEIMDRGSTSCGVSGALYMMVFCITGCPCLYSCFYRSKLRGQYFLEERPCPDCCVHCCFEPCALCQEYRQLRNQGFDMSIGWHGNIERGKQGPSVPPFVKSDMKR